MRQENVMLVMILVLPLVAVCCLGLLVRELIDGGPWRWVFWLIVLVACIVIWLHFLRGVP